MSKIAHSVEELIGHTPLLTLERYGARHGFSAQVLAKLEYLNPAGSAKDRVGLSMIQDAEARGLLKPGAVIIEPTSGNTGIGLACVAAVRGYRLILTMPDTMSAERRAMLAAYGAELVLTPGALGMQGAVEKAEELARSIPGSFIPGQFDNPANPDAHYRTTGPEIWADTQGKVDVLVACVGTGGTLSGTARYLKEQNPAIHVAAVEPDASPLLSGGQAGSHQIQGIGANFIPDTLDRASTIRSSGSGTRTHLLPDGSWSAPRVFWWGSPPARLCGPPPNWPDSRNTRVRPSWSSSPTPATAISPPPCSRNDPWRYLLNCNSAAFSTDSAAPGAMLRGPRLSKSPPTKGFGGKDSVKRKPSGLSFTSNQTTFEHFLKVLKSSAACRKYFFDKLSPRSIAPGAVSFSRYAYYTCWIKRRKAAFPSGLRPYTPACSSTWAKTRPVSF